MEKTLGSICDVRDGTHNSPKYYQKSDYFLVTSKNITAGTLDLTNIKYISKEDFDKINIRSKVDKNDILMPMIGTIGNPLLVNDEDIRYAIKNVALIKSRNNINMKYILYCLKSNIFTRYKNSKKRGGTQKFLSLNDIRELPIPIYGEKEHNNIVRILDAIQEIINIRKEQIRQIDELVKAKFYKLFDNSQLYNKKLTDIAEYNIGLTYKPTDIVHDGTLVLRSGNIQSSQLVFEDNIKVKNKVKEKLLVKENDILMCSRNGSAKLVGKVALIPKLKEDMTFGTFMTVIRSEYYAYLYIFFQTNLFRDQLLSAQTSTINQITRNMLDNIKISVPSKELQDEFAKYIKKVNQQRKFMQESLDQISKLMNDLMRKFF